VNMIGHVKSLVVELVLVIGPSWGEDMVPTRRPLMWSS
jgi:hypothetical protein